MYFMCNVSALNPVRLVACVCIFSDEAFGPGRPRLFKPMALPTGGT